ncbi:DUF1707 and DUF4870 domain-containing protein [Actinoallomurus sp. NPDC052274]|uniref:DUF1707 and DUF4870 domain-containing protein n=1 Tax=Actinoallomurus sp. NPDC052274 TaxID=3155420 RepID=UPI00343A8358
MTISTPTGALRVSAAEREPIVDRLQQAFAEGRLDKEELDLRLHLAMTARTRADLDAALADLTPLPAAHRAPAPVGDPTAEQRVLAALAHVLGATTLFLGPLVMLCTRARRSPYVRRHIVEALNFQLTLLLLTVVTFGLGGIAYAVAWIVCGVAALLALVGTRFRYPFTLRLVH